MSSVAKGVKKVFKRVGQAIKKVAKSKVFKVIAIAAAIYFTAGAAAGAFGSTATVTSMSSALSSIPVVGEGLAAGFTAVAEGAAGLANAAGIGGEFAASLAESASSAIQLAGPGVEGSALADFAAPSGLEGAQPELLNSVAPDAASAAAQANEAGTLAREAAREGLATAPEAAAAPGVPDPVAQAVNASGNAGVEPAASAASPANVTGQPAQVATGSGVPNPVPEATFRDAGGNLVRQVGNNVVSTQPAGIIDKAMAWYSSLDATGKMVLGNAVAQGAGKAGEAYASNRRFEQAQRAASELRDRNQIPNLPVMTRDQIIAAASGNTGQGPSIDALMRRNRG